MPNRKILKIVDVMVFAALVAITFWSFSDKAVAAKIDAAVLPEEINKGFYEVINSRLTVEDEDSESTVSRYSFLKGALDGEIVTTEDWKVLSNSIVYQMQTDTAVLDFQDGTGMVVRQEDFPTGVYGTLQGTEIVGDRKVMDVSDYSKVMTIVKEDVAYEGKPLKDISDFYSYLKALKGMEYTVFIAINDEGTASLNKKLVELLNKLGTKTNLSEVAEDNVFDRIYYGNSYYAVLSGGEALDEKVSKEKLTASGKLSGGTEYEIESAGSYTGEPNTSIKIEGEEYAVNGRGMNFVVYDEKSHEVVDRVCFDTYDGLWCSR